MYDVPPTPRCRASRRRVYIYMHVCVLCFSAMCTHANTHRYTLTRIYCKTIRLQHVWHYTSPFKLHLLLYIFYVGTYINYICMYMCLCVWMHLYYLYMYVYIGRIYIFGTRRNLFLFSSKMSRRLDERVHNCLNFYPNSTSRLPNPIQYRAFGSTQRQNFQLLIDAYLHITDLWPPLIYRYSTIIIYNKQELIAYVD